MNIHPGEKILRDERNGLPIFHIAFCLRDFKRVGSDTRAGTFQQGIFPEIEKLSLHSVEHLSNCLDDLTRSCDRVLSEVDD